MYSRRQYTWYWGWMRLVIGLMQIVPLTVATVFIYYHHNTVAWLLIGIATSATIASRILYRGR
ncbi:MAG: hypothetical protein PW734_11280 [Verrucomicrobium sp.]|nr:hypothetical protein [Verrucomicrobium sp.]